MVERLLFLLFLLIPMQFLNSYIWLIYNCLNFRMNSHPIPSGWWLNLHFGSCFSYLNFPYVMGWTSIPFLSISTHLSWSLIFFPISSYVFFFRLQFHHIPLIKSRDWNATVTAVGNMHIEWLKSPPCQIPFIPTVTAEPSATATASAAATASAVAAASAAVAASPAAAPPAASVLGCV